LKKIKRHSHNPGIAGSQGCHHNNDLHPCIKQGRARCEESDGWTLRRWFIQTV